jgi:hypothetical protein
LCMTSEDSFFVSALSAPVSAISAIIPSTLALTRINYRRTQFQVRQSLTYNQKGLSHEISSFRRLQRSGEEVLEAGEVLENQYNGGAEVQRATEDLR